jgi:hypothetical protein
MPEALGGITAADEDVIVDMPAGDLEGDEPLSIDDEMLQITQRIEQEEKDAAEGKPQEAKPDGRPRNADGTFVKADPKAPAAPVAPDAFVDKGPPTSWRPTAKAQWERLTPELKAEAYKREDDFFKGTETFRAKANVADALWGIIAPYQPLIAAERTDVPTAISELFATAAALQAGSPAQKVATLRRVAERYGIDLNSLGNANARPDQFADPQIHALQQELASLKGFLTNQQAQSQNSEVRAAMAQIEDFGRNPEHRYFQDVRFQMGALMNQGLAQSLPEAYAMACKIHPQVSAAVAAEQQQKAENERQQAAIKRANDAQRAARLGPRSSPVGTVPKGGSIDDTMKAVWDAMNAT